MEIWNLSRWVWRGLKGKSITSRIAKAIQSILKPPRTPITPSEIQQELLESQDAALSKSNIRRYIREVMKFSYIKVSSRPPKVLSNESKASKACLWVDFLSLLLKGAYIVNVDESWFNRSLKQMYSWLPRRKGGIIVHENHKGRTSLVVGVWVKDGWIGMIKNDTVNSKEFLVFVKVLGRLVQSLFSNENKQVIVILDNAPTHSSLTAMSVYNSMNSRYLFLPPYSPEVAPVELFFWNVKKKMRKELAHKKLILASQKEQRQFSALEQRRRNRYV